MKSRVHFFLTSVESKRRKRRDAEPQKTNPFPFYPNLLHFHRQSTPNPNLLRVPQFQGCVRERALVPGARGQTPRPLCCVGLCGFPFLVLRTRHLCIRPMRHDLCALEGSLPSEVPTLPLFSGRKASVFCSLTGKAPSRSSITWPHTNLPPSDTPKTFHRSLQAISGRRCLRLFLFHLAFDTLLHVSRPLLGFPRSLLYRFSGLLELLPRLERFRF